MARTTYRERGPRFGVADAKFAVLRDKRRVVREPLVGSVTEGPRGPAEPSPEGSLERARVLVAEQEPHLRHGELAVTQERWRHLPAELCEHGGERRLLVAELALEGAGARAQHLRHSVQTRDRFRQLGPQHPAHPLAHGSLAAERRERLLGQPVEIAGEGGNVGHRYRPREILVPQ